MKGMLVINNGLPVPLGFNLPRNRFRVSTFARSEINDIPVQFYEYHGLYWYSLGCLKPINSVGFVGIRNCVSSFRETLKCLRRWLSPSDCATLLNFVRNCEKSPNTKKVAA